MTEIPGNTAPCSIPPRIIFMGSADIACPTLRALLASPSVRTAGIVTQPERPSGRKLQSTPCAVRKEAHAAGVPVWTPANVNDPASLAVLRRTAPDIIAVMAYGQFLGDKLLDLPPLGCINAHLSLLPEYRGAAPVQWAIANGETETGITIMRMVRRMDAGDILFQQSFPISPEDTATSLGRRLGLAAAPLLLHVILQMVKGNIHARPQDEAAATYAPRLRKEDGRIDWTMSAVRIERRLRAFTPWPGCFCTNPAKKTKPHSLRVLRAFVEPAHTLALNADAAPPGTVLDTTGAGPLVAAGQAALRLLEVQPEGKRRMSGRAYVCGYHLGVGDRLE